jgi:hypothetical protein
MSDDFPPALLPPAPPPEGGVALKETLRRGVRFFLSRMVRYSGSVQPPPPKGEAVERAAYGAAQPLLGLRVLLRDQDLLVEALKPAGWLALACGVYASLHTGSLGLTGAWLKTFYTAFAVLAPVPSILFANHYARFAALVRWRLGFGAVGPREYPLMEHMKRAVMQALLAAAAIAPVLGLTGALPFGAHLTGLVAAVWGLHWVVVDAFDDASVLQPGQTVRDLEREAEHKPRPWFVRSIRWVQRQVPERMGRLRGVIRTFGDFLDRLAKPWREEIALLESSPRLLVGFALSTATLLAIPGLNLLFRPIIIAGATHLLGHLEQAEHVEDADALEAKSEPPEPVGPKPAPLGERPLRPQLGDRFGDDE